MKRMKLIFKYSLVLLLPVVFLLVGLNIHLAKFGNDPNYVYLLNSTAICDGENVGYIDHPGTTVIQIGAAAIAVQHFLSDNDQTLVRHVLEHPHEFVLGIRNVLLVLNTLILIVLGWVAIRKTKSVWIAILLQASTLITTNALDHIWTKISPEPFLFFITCIYVIAGLYFYFEENKNSYKYVIIFSLITGAGLATKATFLPLAIFPFLVIPTYKKKFIYAFGIIPAFVLFTIPIIPEYENMYYWFRGLSSHSGIYGHGEKGFINLNTYLPNIIAILKNNPVFAVVLLLGLIVATTGLVQLVRKKQKLSRELHFLGGLLTVGFFGVLFVAKHYHSNHYLIPELLLVGLITFFIIETGARKLGSNSFRKIIYPLIAIAFVAYVFIKQPPRIQYFDYGYQITNEEMDSTRAMIENKYPGYTKIYYYPNSLNIYSALNFGDVYTQRRLLPEIKNVHGDVYFYHSIGKVIKNWNTEIYLDDLVKREGKRILLIGGPRDEQEAEKMWENGFPLDNIYRGRLQAIYKLDTIAYNYQELRKKNAAEFIVFNAEKTTENGEAFIASNGRKIGNTANRTAEKAKSGNYSVKMDSQTEYALEYKLYELKEGEDFEVTIWRYPAQGSGILVIASEDAKLFYKTQNSVIQTDEDGWGLLRIRFTVPPELGGKMLKIYLWNRDKETIYYDDLSISTISKNTGIIKKGNLKR